MVLVRDHPSATLFAEANGEAPDAVADMDQRMGEGDRNGDLTVVAIERDGVVVERNGQRARVPLP